MELTNEFRVDRPIEETWNVLTDVERIAPALPGAQLQEIEGDEYRGIVKVKVGPITAQYKGKATFVEKDDTNHKAVLRAEGRDTKGQGNASALDHGVARARRAGHEGHRAHRPHGHRQGRPVRSRHHGRRQQRSCSTSSSSSSRRRSSRETPARRRSPTRRWRWQRPNRKRRSRRRTRRRRRRSVGSTIPSPSRSTSSARRGTVGGEARGADRHRRVARPLVRAWRAASSPRLGGRRRGGRRRRRHRAARQSASLCLRCRRTRLRRPARRDPKRASPRRRHAHADAVLARREDESERVSRLEAAAACKAAERAVDRGGAAARPCSRTPRSATRPSLSITSGPRPSGGVGGTRQGVKCLHAHYAAFLAGSDDPVGRWVAARLREQA